MPKFVNLEWSKFDMNYNDNIPHCRIFLNIKKYNNWVLKIYLRNKIFCMLQGWQNLSNLSLMIRLKIIFVKKGLLKIYIYVYITHSTSM